jgi:hypothetical protein
MYNATTRRAVGGHRPTIIVGDLVVWEGDVVESAAVAHDIAVAHGRRAVAKLFRTR